MDTNIWLPLATLILGWAGAQVTDMLRDRRTTDRERLARRTELQRTTLLALQDHMLEVFKLTARWPGLDADGKTQLRDAAIESRTLASRVAHEDARKATNDFLAAALPLGHPNPDVQYGEDKQATSLYIHATGLIGKLLREQY